MSRKSLNRNRERNDTIINFSVGDRTYQIDTQRGKVYRRFVEIETAKAFEIFSVWRASSLNA